MTDHADLTAALRYDCGRCRPCTRFKREAADALDAADAENARLTAERDTVRGLLSVMTDIAERRGRDEAVRERDEALAEVAQLRAERQAVIDCLNLYGDEIIHDALDAIGFAPRAVSEEATDAEGGSL